MQIVNDLRASGIHCILVHINTYTQVTALFSIGILGKLAAEQSVQDRTENDKDDHKVMVAASEHKDDDCGSQATVYQNASELERKGTPI